MKVTSAPRIEIKLRVGNQDLEELNIPDLVDEWDSVAKYIEVTPGANFSVHFSASADAAPQPRYQVQLVLSLDGERAGSRTYSLHKGSGQPTNRQLTKIWEGLNRHSACGSSFHRFMFTDLHTCEHDSDAAAAGKLTQILAHLGDITVDCHWVIETGKRPNINTKAPREYMSQHTDIPEKALKGRALSAKVTLGAAEPSRQSTHSSKLSYPTGKKPFARYVFRYRLRKDLQVEGVIPCSPTPVPLEDRVIDSLSLEEARRLLTKQREQKHSPALVKGESDEEKKATSDAEGVEIIMQRSAKRTRRSPDPAAEVVDLTGLLD